MSEDEAPRLRSPYSRIAIEWLMVALFGGLVLCILGVAAALVFWAWSA